MESIFEMYHKLVRVFLFNAFFIFLILSIISIFKKNLIEHRFLKVISYILITIGILNFILFLVNFDSYTNRAFGVYWLLFWLMILFHSLLPLILLIPKIQKKIISFLIVFFLMQMGRFFELIVILTTSFHRDYLP